MRPDYLWHQIT